MLDLQFIRDHTDAVKAAITNKSAGDPASVDALLELDADWRRITTDLQETQTLANTAARQIGELMKSGQKDQAQSAIAESSRLKGVTKELEDAQRQAQDALSALLLEIPNVPHSSVPVGATPDDNVTAYEWGSKSEFDFTAVPHWDLLDKWEMADFDRGSKVSGAGFPFYKGAGA